MECCNNSRLNRSLSPPTSNFLASTCCGVMNPEALPEGPFDRPFDKLTVLSKVEGLTALSKGEGRVLRLQ